MRVGVVVAVVVQFCGALALAQDLGVGRLLVASRKSRDAELARTVILLVNFDEQGAIGLIVNRPSKVTLPVAFPELKGAKGRSDPVYAGGPVAVGIRALFRSRTQPEKAIPVFAGVYLI